MERAQVLKLTKHQADNLLHLLVRIKANLAVRGPDITNGKRETQFAAPGFIEFALSSTLSIFHILRHNNRQ